MPKNAGSVAPYENADPATIPATSNTKKLIRPLEFCGVDLATNTARIAYATADTPRIGGTMSVNGYIRVMLAGTGAT
jgi:hypothetical protein